MQNSAPGKRPKKRKTQNAMVSHSSILIISAFLIGIGAGKTSNPALGMSLFMVGIFGFVSYFGLGHLAQERKARAARRRKERAAKKLELRMGRHIPRRNESSSTESYADEQNADLASPFSSVAGTQQMSSC